MSAVLVDVGEQRLVLGVTASQITCLATQARPENAPQASAPATFPLMLEKLRQKYRPEVSSETSSAAGARPDVTRRRCAGGQR